MSDGRSVGGTGSGPTSVLTVVGARPQFIKAATVSRVIRSRDDVTETLVHTGQHYDHGMSDVFFEELDIPRPDVNLQVGSLSHGAQTGRMLERLEQVIDELRPDWVLVYGDTNSTLAGALAAAKLHVPVAHVEAGLRSFNRRMPEEVNRILTDHASDLLLPPTDTATRNLANEGIPAGKVVQVGDVMFDAALHYARLAPESSEVLTRLDLRPGEYVLATVHRAENTDDPARLRGILAALDEVARNMPVVLPAHPRTRAALDLAGVTVENVRLIEPVGYLDMVMLESNAQAVVTDSGGVQKEAYFHGVPCITLRQETEWTELVDAGWNRLLDPDEPDELASAIVAAAGSRPVTAPRFYGEGDAAERVVAALLEPRA